jgi:HPt (histidine-containing phosphotransfer) domain-containing protein
MIIYENGKIIAISKELLNLLNVSLEEISHIINKIKLETALLNKNEIEILNYKFNVKKEELLTLKNLDVYILKITETIQTLKITEISPNTTETSLSMEDNLLKISPKKTYQEPVCENKQSIEKDLVQISTKEEISPAAEQIPELNIPEEKPIELNFEDNISECEKIFEQKNRINEIIKEELSIATKELGIDENLANELFEDLLNQIINKKEALFKAIENKDYESIHKIAHFLKGASLNLRLSNLAFIFKTIDEESKNKTDIDVIKDIAVKLYDYIAPLINKEIKSNKEIIIEPKIKNFVINTIRYYLETQDEKKFHQDKKHIEKLLNIKIDSLNELEKILKES